MRARSVLLRLTDMLEPISRVREATVDISLDQFAANWQKAWLVERGIEIISEASRYLPDELKARHPQMPWQDVAGIGNVLRHD